MQRDDVHGPDIIPAVPTHVMLNGNLVPSAQAAVRASDAGFTHGVGLFSTLRVYGGRPFRAAAHCERLAASARALSLPPPPPAAKLIEQMLALLKADGLIDARMRVTVTPGDLRTATVVQRPSGSDEDAHADDSPACTVLITATAADPPLPPAAQGMTVCISSFRQTTSDPTAGHKTLSYFPRLIGMREAQARHCGESLWFTPHNLLAEACMSNVMLVKDGALRTPPLATPILPGVTRATVLELARHAGIAVEEAPLTIDDLLAADEVFLTNAVIEVMPVLRIERHAVGGEQPGSVTRILAAAYRDAVQHECHP